MTLATYALAALAVDAAVGLATGLLAGRPRRPGRWAGVLAVSLGLAFAALSALVVVYEVAYSTGRPAAGFA